MALLALGGAGAGVPIVPDDTLDGTEQFPALIDGAGDELVKELWLVWRTKEWVSPTVRHFLDVVRSHIAPVD